MRAGIHECCVQRLMCTFSRYAYVHVLIVHVTRGKVGKIVDRNPTFSTVLGYVPQYKHVIWWSGATSAVEAHRERCPIDLQSCKLPARSLAMCNEGYLARAEQLSRLKWMSHQMNCTE
jgi:hypothetical protein